MEQLIKADKQLDGVKILTGAVVAVGADEPPFDEHELSLGNKPKSHNVFAPIATAWQSCQCLQMLLLIRLPQASPKAKRQPRRKKKRPKEPTKANGITESCI